MTEELMVTTGSRSPYIPSYVSYAEGHIECPLILYFRDFQINIENFEVSFIYNNMALSFTPMPIEGEIQIMKTRSPVHTEAVTSPLVSPMSRNLFVQRTEWKSQEHPIRKKPNLTVTIPSVPVLSTSPLTPTPIETDDPKPVVSEVLQTAGQCSQAAVHGLHNKTWLPYNIILQTLIWLPDILRQYVHQ